MSCGRRQPGRAASRRRGVGEARMWMAEGTVGAMGCEWAVELGRDDMAAVEG
jgi:hypothetical protein